MNFLLLILILFTDGGPAYSVVPFQGSLEDCQAETLTAKTLIGKKIPGPSGEPVTILDAQSECRVYGKQIEVKN